MISTLVVLAALSGLAQTADPPVVVFLLAGQSNMEGQAVVDLVHEKHYNGGRGTLIRLMEDSKKSSMFRHLRGTDGSWTSRQDVQVWYQPGRGELKKGPLSIGFAFYGGKHHFGPELQFGHHMGDHFASPVLLIKTAWGGKSLGKDFRPPSADGDEGLYYRRMIDEYRSVTRNLGQHFPQWKGRPVRLAGFVWFQGWNDMFEARGVEDYEKNLVNLIKDLRRELASPRLPVVIGETGNADKPELHAAQRAAAERKEFTGTAAFVPTRAFLRKATDSPNVGHGHHWYGNAESYFLIGDAMGKAMKRILLETTKK